MKNFKKFERIALTCALLLSMMPAFATDSNITNVTGVNGVFNIDPATTNNGVGFRQYQNFDLKQGDIANLKYDKDNISTFVNLVDNQIKVDGIVNTVKGNNFYDGKAVFVSPNGMVVGASGVLNVGSLGVYVPAKSKYNALKSNKTAQNFKEFAKDDDYSDANKHIIIHGKVISAGDVDLKGGTVMNTGSGIMLGVNPDAMEKFTSHDQANDLFSSLVNTNGFVNADLQFKNLGKAGIKIIASDNDKIMQLAPINNFASKSSFTGIALGSKYNNGEHVGRSENSNDYMFTGYYNGEYYDDGNFNSDKIDEKYKGIDPFNSWYSDYVDGNYQTESFYSPQVWCMAQGCSSVAEEDYEDYLAWDSGYNGSSNISGIMGENGVYNIDPETKNTSTGFRKYENFTLAKGDVANLNYDGIETFVNFVDNRININGIVNTVKNGSFYNGKAMFISPNGMIVGPRGVLNVGSLGVYTPSQANFDDMKENLYYSDDLLNGNDADILIHGKIIASGDVDLRGDNVDIYTNTIKTDVHGGLSPLDGIDRSKTIGTNDLSIDLQFNNDGTVSWTTYDGRPSTAQGLPLDVVVWHEEDGTEVVPINLKFNNDGTVSWTTYDGRPSTAQGLPLDVVVWHEEGGTNGVPIGLHFNNDGTVNWYTLANDIDNSININYLISPISAAGVVYGVNENAMQVLTSNEQANTVFSDMMYGDNAAYQDYNKGASMTIHTIPAAIHIDPMNPDYTEIRNYAGYDNFTGVINNQKYVNGEPVSNSSALAGYVYYRSHFTGYHNGKYYEKGNLLGNNEIYQHGLQNINTDTNVDAHYTGVAERPFYEADGIKMSKFYRNGQEDGIIMGYTHVDDSNNDGKNDKTTGGVIGKAGDYVKNGDNLKTNGKISDKMNAQTLVGKLTETTNSITGKELVGKAMTLDGKVLQMNSVQLKSSLADKTLSKATGVINTSNLVPVSRTQTLSTPVVNSAPAKTVTASAPTAESTPAQATEQTQADKPDESTLNDKTPDNNKKDKK